MIITRLQGGLGNQMFQYALGRTLSLKNGTELRLDTILYDKNNFRNFGLGAFHIQATKATPEDVKSVKPQGISSAIDALRPVNKKRLLKEKGFSFQPTVLEAGNPVYLECSINGGWQSEKYFIEAADIIRKDFEFKDFHNEKFQTLLSKVTGTNSVSLHLRRTDYLQPKHQKIYAEIVLSYYERALEKVSAAEVFIFSDDIEWVKANLKLQNTLVTYVSDQGFTDSQELFLMSQCKHNITANSTFSWWGAWLNQNPHKIVITPRQWFIDGRNESDLIPKSWTKL
jgi:hypothetical protein